MTNLDSILKSRDITLPTKLHLVKAVVFPAVMYRCESWTIKKTEHQRTDAFELWCWRRLGRVPWTARRSNQFILKEISPEYSLDGPEHPFRRPRKRDGRHCQRADPLGTPRLLRDLLRLFGLSPSDDPPGGAHEPADPLHLHTRLDRCGRRRTDPSAG